MNILLWNIPGWWPVYLTVIVLAKVGSLFYFSQTLNARLNAETQNLQENRGDNYLNDKYISHFTSSKVTLKISDNETVIFSDVVFRISSE